MDMVGCIAAVTEQQAARFLFLVSLADLTQLVVIEHAIRVQNYAQHVQSMIRANHETGFSPYIGLLQQGTGVEHKGGEQPLKHCKQRLSSLEDLGADSVDKQRIAKG